MTSTTTQALNNCHLRASPHRNTYQDLDLSFLHQVATSGHHYNHSTIPTTSKRTNQRKHNHPHPPNHGRVSDHLDQVRRDILPWSIDGTYYSSRVPASLPPFLFVQPTNHHTNREHPMLSPPSSSPPSVFSPPAPPPPSPSKPSNTPRPAPP